MNPDGSRRVRTGVLVLSSVVLGGTLWYWLLEGFTPLDALYQTVTTVTTVGFGEVQELDASGRAFTMGVILVGVGAGVYTLSGLFEYVVGRQIDRFGRRRVERELSRVHDHAVICGYGRIGSRVAELVGPEMPVIVVDQDEARAQEAREDGHLVVRGDAADDEVLDEAHLHQARILVAALPTDADNLYVVLTGRTLNTDLHIVSRAQHAGSGAKLLRAGADRVVNPEDIGAQRLAAFATRPAVSEFLEVVMHGSSVEYRMEEFTIRDASTLTGVSLGDAEVRERTGALVLALRSRGGTFATNPPPDTPLDSGITLIAIGTDEQLRSLARLTA